MTLVCFYIIIATVILCETVVILSEAKGLALNGEMLRRLAAQHDNMAETI